GSTPEGVGDHPEQGGRPLGEALRQVRRKRGCRGGRPDGRVVPGGVLAAGVTSARFQVTLRTRRRPTRRWVQGKRGFLEGRPLAASAGGHVSLALGAFEPPADPSPDLVDRLAGEAVAGSLEAREVLG